MRIVIGEDSALFREGLASLLTDSGHEIVAKAADAPSLVTAVDATEPDLAVIDIRMPPDHTDDGARAARTVRARHPRTGIVLLSQHVETRHSVELVSSGGFGYLFKDRVLDVDDFLDAPRRVAAGGSALDPEVVTRLLAGRGAGDPLAALTPPASGRCWPRWPRAGPTSASPAGSGSPNARWRPTSVPSWPNWAWRPTRRTTAASRPSWSS